ncbi:hypothetical protein [Streptomyces bobili]
MSEQHATCCGRPMQRDGNQYVCRKCGAWIDPGTAATEARQH